MKRLMIFCVLCALCGPVFGANEIRSFNAGATTCYVLSNFFMTENAQWNNVKPVFFGVSFPMMIFLGRIMAYTNKFFGWRKIASSYTNHYRCLCFARLIMQSFGVRISLYFLALFTLMIFLFNFFAVLTMTPTAHTFLPFWAFGIFTMTFLTPRIMPIFGFATFAKIREQFNSVASTALFRYDIRSHFNLLHRLFWSKPVAGTHLRLAYFIVLTTFVLSTNLFAANEVRAFSGGTITAYYVVREVSGTIWYPTGQVFEAFGTAGRVMADYDIPLVDKTAGMYVGNFDTNVPTGTYYAITHQQAGGSPADADPAVWQEHGYWDGSIWGSDVVAALPTKEQIRQEIDANSTQLAAIVADTNELQTDWTNGGRLDLLLDAVKAITDILPAKNTTVSVEDDANSFTLTAGLAVADAYNGMTIYVQDATDGNWIDRLIIDWTAARVVTVDEPFPFTPTVADVAVIWGLTSYPMDVFDGLPLPPKPEVITIDRRATTAGGGTTTLDVMGEDP